MRCISTKKVVIELHLSTRCLTPYRQRLVCIQQKEKQELLAATKFVCYNCITNLLYTLGVRKAWWSKLYAVYFNQQMVLLTLFPLWNVPFSVCLTFLPHYEDTIYRISDMDGSAVEINSMEAVKVCGVIFSYNEALAYKANSTDKITNLETKSRDGYGEDYH